ncbi:MAG: SAVED domain-containing protein [Candidatus Pacebacteria bacterium]|nr:SAVED domain-containing protein [Candidatus Paceibacterota bacterium]
MHTTENSGKSVKRISRDKIKSPTKDVLIVRSGGRCQFNGCNRYLFKHSLTQDEGNYAQVAHIVAYSKQGPRASQLLTKEYINDPENLMLLCHECHHLVDTKPESYTVELLKKYKHEHEERVFQQTEIKSELKTSILQLKSIIGSQAVDIPAADVRMAIAPRFPVDAKGCVMDLTQFSQEDPAFYSVAKDYINKQVDAFLSAGVESLPIKHISLFALAPIPILVFLGSKLGNKIALNAYQRHRDTEDWKWKDNEDPLVFTYEKIKNGNDPHQVSLVVSVSGNIMSDNPPNFTDDTSVYLLTPEGGKAGYSILKNAESVHNFQKNIPRAFEFNP